MDLYQDSIMTTPSIRGSAISFNGGKMSHVFVPGKGRYEEGFTSDTAKRCFEDTSSIVSLKVHGECCILVRRPITQDPNMSFIDTEGSACPVYEWIFGTRLDTKGKSPPENHIPVPTQEHTSDRGEAKLLHPAVFQKHTYCFVPLDKDLVVGKGGKKTKPGPDTYAAIDAGVKSGALPDPNADNAPDYITVEWIGRKHQGNMDCLDVDHAITIHGSTVVPIPVRTRAAIEQMAREVSIEGLVFQDRESGERFKLRFDMMVDDSLFAMRTKQRVSTPESTSIKPSIIKSVSGT